MRLSEVGSRGWLVNEEARFKFFLGVGAVESVALARAGGLVVNRVAALLEEGFAGGWEVESVGVRGAVKWVFACLSGGLLEAREGQQALSCRIVDAMLHGEVLVAEAPTGVGKTLAYMVGGYCAAGYESGLSGVGRLEGCPVVVATATKALQEQVWDKDVAKFVGAGLWDWDDVALLKGKGSYLCLDRADRALAEWEGGRDGDEELERHVSGQGWSVWGEPELRKMVQDVRLKKWNGDFDVRKVVKLKSLSGVEVDGGQCLGSQCDSYIQCPYMRLRGSLGRKRLIVTNQDLVLSDLGVRTMTGGAGRVLPVNSYAVVFDEGHHLVSKGIDQGLSEIKEGVVNAVGDTLTWVLKELELHERGATGDLSAMLWSAYKEEGSGLGLKTLKPRELGVETRKMKTVYAGLVDRVFEEQVSSRRSGVHRFVYSLELPEWIRVLWEQKGSIVVEGRKVLMAAAAAYTRVADELVKACSGGSLEGEERRVAKEYAKIAKAGQIKIQAGLEAATHIYRVWKYWLVDGDMVKWVEWPQKVDGDIPAWERPEVAAGGVDWRDGRGGWSLHVCPLSAAQYLVPGVWSWVGMGGKGEGEKSFWLRGCAVLSATLRGTSSFDLLSDNLGLLRQEEVRGVKRTLEERTGTDVFRGESRVLLKSKVGVGYVALDPVFDASKTVLEVVNVGAGGGYPERRLFTSRVCAALPEVLKPLLGGRGEGALVLCNSWEMLRVVAKEVGPVLESLGWEVRVQGSTGVRPLVERHIGAVESGGRSVLLGTQSLAEGLDLPGALCMHVVLVSLPFASNSSPLESALEEVLGSRYFEDRALQEVAIKLVQMTGRLVRSPSDWGRITMLDHRLQTKGYGKKLRARLPAYEWKVSNWSQKLAHVQPKAYESREPLPLRTGWPGSRKESHGKRPLDKKAGRGVKRNATKDGSGDLF